MKIERKNLKKIIEILNRIPYNPVKENCNIAFPIETDKLEDFGGIELTVQNKELGVRRAPSPVLLLNYNAETPVVLAYADITYSRNFDILDYCDLLNYKISKSDVDVLENLESVLVDKQNIFMSFEI